MFAQTCHPKYRWLQHQVWHVHQCWRSEEKEILRSMVVRLDRQRRCDMAQIKSLQEHYISHISLCLIIVKPPVAQVRACSTEKLELQAHLLGRSDRVHPYLRLVASRKPPLWRCTWWYSYAWTTSTPLLTHVSSSWQDCILWPVWFSFIQNMCLITW